MISCDMTEARIFQYAILAKWLRHFCLSVSTDSLISTSVNQGSKLTFHLGASWWLMVTKFGHQIVNFDSKLILHITRIRTWFCMLLCMQEEEEELKQVQTEQVGLLSYCCSQVTHLWSKDDGFLLSYFKWSEAQNWFHSWFWWGDNASTALLYFPYATSSQLCSF